jgi:hypothetical protein
MAASGVRRRVPADNLQVIIKRSPPKRQPYPGQGGDTQLVRANLRLRYPSQLPCAAPNPPGQRSSHAGGQPAIHLIPCWVIRQHEHAEYPVNDVGVTLTDSGDEMKTVIAGGVAAGASTGARLRRLDESAEIVVLERDRYLSIANQVSQDRRGGR